MRRRAPVSRRLPSSAGGGRAARSSSETRELVEPRLGVDLGNVRIHAGDGARENARTSTPSVRARLAGVEPPRISAAPAGVVQRQPLYDKGLHDPSTDYDTAAERAYGGKGAPKAQKCGRPSWCPKGFCDPYSSQPLAEYYRAKKGPFLMAGISLAVDSRVVPLWKEYLSGGSAPKNLTTDFGADFTKSPTTKKTTQFLYDELKKSIAAKPPTVPQYSNHFIDIPTRIPAAVAALDDPASADSMDFNIPKDIPGNLAGGVGKDQLACPAGAIPSPFNDERKVKGMANVIRTSGADLTVAPSITYTVKDTIDLCPGNCGTALEQIATVPLSQFEATGISGDVPFTVEFPAPALPNFTVSAPLPPAPKPAAPAPKPAAPKPVKKKPVKKKP